MEELHKILEGMDIPILRYNDLPWLNRNIEINNSKHPDLMLAKLLIQNLQRRNK